MKPDGLKPDVAAKLKIALLSMQNNPEIKPAVEARDEVLARYQPVFTPDGIAKLSAEEFRDFLMFRNNRHWSGLQRMGLRATEDMGALRAALSELLDEETPVSRRLDRLLPEGRARVKKLGKAILTPILLIAHPDRYGVWNGTSEGAMEQLGIWPEFDRGTSVGEQYVQNKCLALENRA